MMDPAADSASARTTSSAEWRVTFAGGLLAVLVVRLVYLARYGWDPGWMNLNYLSWARKIALGVHQPFEERPLTYLALVGARRLGASARTANEIVYLVGHLLLASGALGLARFVWPAASARRRAALCATLALVPLLATQTGRDNLGVTLAAGLGASALALGASAATAARVGPATLAALLLAALGTAGRYEAFATCAGGALVFAVLGGRMPALPGHRRAAAALTGGVLAGIAAVSVVQRAVGGGPAHDPTYAFYTFFDGLPALMSGHLGGSEYGRYRASAALFGGFAANHGSLVRALLHHPGFALLRFLTKPVDLLLGLLWVYGLTPIGVALATVGLGGTVAVARRGKGRPRSSLLAAYVFPLGMLVVPQLNPAYYVSVAVPLCLMMARGADRVGARLRPEGSRLLGGAMVVGALALIIGAGKLGISNSRVIDQAVPYLEQRCTDGCLTSALPQVLRYQAWVITDAGAPFPANANRDERAIFGERRAVSPELYDFCARAARSRAAGFHGPVLYVDPRIKSFRAFDPNFDPEVRYQGTVDRATLVEARRFSVGDDELVIYDLPPETDCRRATAD